MTLEESCKAISILMQTISVKFARTQDDNYSIQGVTPSQAAILLFLDETGAQKVKDIAAALNMAESNVSNICSRLEKAGFVKRQRQNSDQRVVKIELDDGASGKIEDIKREMNVFLRKMQQFVTETDVNDIYIGLQKLDRLLDLFLENNESRG